MLPLFFLTAAQHVAVAFMLRRRALEPGHRWGASAGGQLLLAIGWLLFFGLLLFSQLRDHLSSWWAWAGSVVGLVVICCGIRVEKRAREPYAAN
jgi:hypothetical protein